MAPDTATQADFSFVHFTDTHIMAGGNFSFPTGERQFDTSASLQRVIDVINTLEPPPAFAVIGGDLTSPDLLDRSKVLTPEEYEPSYRLLQDLLRPLPCPTYMLLGNHDNRTAFHRVMQTAAVTPDAPHHYSFDHQGYHFIALDSLHPGASWGYLEAPQLVWLRDDLETHRGRPTLVFVHHHPWALGIEWLDQMHLRNGDELWQLLQAHADVRWVICGHVHLDQAIQRDGLTMLTTPSTGFQISKLSQTRKILPGPPGFRLVRVKGLELSTRVLHLHGASAADL
ncbi:MAG: metallophosphoesterase [Gammaproteobacteria bacterium]